MAARSGSQWSEDDIPSQAGRVCVVTGSNTGIGFHTARALCAKGATVVLACRNQDKARDAASQIRDSTSAGSVLVEDLDLSSLDSIEKFSGRIHDSFEHLDLLVNNAGVMWTPPTKTADGFELQFGTNHLGHFALTLRLVDLLASTAGSRVVTVSSQAHRTGSMHFDDIHLERHYGRHKAYAQSKLANLLFTYELDARLRSAGAPTIALAAHPGASSTEVIRNSSSWLQGLYKLRLASLVNQDAAAGALPTLRAATDPRASGGDYFGPSGLFEIHGPPKKVASTSKSHDKVAQRRLWELSQTMTGLTYPSGS